MPDHTTPFTERGFYLSEFRGRTLGFVLPPGEDADVAPLRAVFEALQKNATRIVLMAAGDGPASGFEMPVLEAADESEWPARVWRRLGSDGAVGLSLGGGAFESAVKSATLRLGLSKLVWLRSSGGLCTPDGAPISFIDRRELRRHRQAETGRAPGETALLAEIESMLEGGVPAVNLCSPAGLDDELFTYSGSGTLFTRERYVEVRALSVDDYDAASDLIARGVAEGYLVERDQAGLDRVLSGGIGVFIEGRDLAGVGSLLPHSDASAAEIASLYTVTRYLGEGIGHQIVAFAVRRAREAGYGYVFACTTSEPVAVFFERSGFVRVDGDAIPEAKWRGYPAERRARLICMRIDLASPHP
jgi:amino-acid N-acetyltransferase